MYSYGDPGSFNPAVITNKEAHMIYGNIVARYVALACYDRLSGALD